MMTMGMLAPNSADAVVLVRSAAQLSRAPEFGDIRPFWRSVSAGMVLYDKCGDAYKVTPDQMAYLKSFYQDLWENYLATYEALYQKRVGYPSPPKIVAEYTQLITDEQQGAANAMMTSIKKHGCKRATVRRTYDFLMKYRPEYERQKAAAEKAAKEEAEKRAADPFYKNNPFESSEEQ